MHVTFAIQVGLLHIILEKDNLIIQPKLLIMTIAIQVGFVLGILEKDNLIIQPKLLMTTIASLVGNLSFEMFHRPVQLDIINKNLPQIEIYEFFRYRLIINFSSHLIFGDPKFSTRPIITTSDTLNPTEVKD